MESTLVQQILEHWDELAGSAQRLTFQPGQVLYYAGHYPYGLFVLQSGEVAFQAGNLDCAAAHRLATPVGHFLGMFSFFTDLPYCCSCTATAPSQVLFLSKTQLRPVVGKPTVRPSCKSA